MVQIINYNLLRKKYKNKTIIFRIHETGDFWSEEYLNKWIEISNKFKGENRIIFQAYTKSIAFLKDLDIQELNIKIMFSIMPDTNPADIILAQQLGLNTFSAVPIEWFENLEEEKKCEGNCANCKSCYLEDKDMFVEFHGNRAPRRKARIDYDKQIYWAWKYKEL